MENEIDLEKCRSHGSLCCHWIDNVHGKCKDCSDTWSVRMRRSLRCCIDQDHYNNQREAETSIDRKILNEIVL